MHNPVVDKPFQTRSRQALRVLGNTVIAILWTYFIYTNLTAFLWYGKLSAFLFAISESFITVLFIIREPAKAVSNRPIDWIATFAAIAPIYFYRPSFVSDSLIGNVLITFGVLLTIAGMMSLNSSYGIIAAVRTVKTDGLYRFIRHPVYASYFVTFAGYFLSNPTLNNLLVVIISLSAQVMRIRAEERILMTEPLYRAYAAKVRWRLLPHVY